MISSKKGTEGNLYGKICEVLKLGHEKRPLEKKGANVVAKLLNGRVCRSCYRKIENFHSFKQIALQNVYLCVYIKSAGMERHLEEKNEVPQPNRKRGIFGEKSAAQQFVFVSMSIKN